MAVLLAAWGLASAAAPVAWGTWLARTLPGDAEAGGGIIVATMPLAITLGAVAGGLAFDAHGPVASAAVSAAVLAVAALAALLARPRTIAEGLRPTHP